MGDDDMNTTIRWRSLGALVVCSLILSGAQCGHSGDETSSEKEMKQSDESDEQTESAEQAAQASNEMDSKDDDMNQSARERVNDPEVDDKTLAALVEGNSTFGFELYQKLRNRSEQNRGRIGQAEARPARVRKEEIVRLTRDLERQG